MTVRLWGLGLRSHVVYLQTAQTWANAGVRISESTTGYTFTPCVGSPGIDTRKKGPPASERHRQVWGE